MWPKPASSGTKARTGATKRASRMLLPPWLARNASPRAIAWLYRRNSGQALMRDSRARPSS